MEKVFPVEIVASFPRRDLRVGKSSFNSPQVAKEGLIERVLEPGYFVVVMGDGSKIAVRGSDSLRPGNQVRVLPSPLKSDEPEIPVRIRPQGEGGTGGFQSTVFMPLAFGGDKASARLEIFVERQVRRPLEKTASAVYFVFTVQTEGQGELQWSIYLKGKQVTLQVHAQPEELKKERLKNLVREVEKSLKTKGYSMMGPTVFLNRPFKAPEGFRLNVRG